jgi:hypothetical protein
LRVGIIQSNYIPWRGYFDIIGQVDLFIFYDDVQYTKGDWRNRNKIKTSRGPDWLTVPVGTDLKRLICEVEINDSRWQKDHFDRITANYHSAPFLNDMLGFLESIYLETKWTNLSELNQHIIARICREFLGITTPFEDSRRFELTGKKGERVIELLKQAGATSYLSGPAAKNYLDPARFEEAGIALEWMDYSGYHPYKQLHPPFDGAVSIIDMLLMLGPDTPRFAKIGKAALPWRQPVCVTIQ